MIKAFHEPIDFEEALSLKRKGGERVVFLAGGTEVNSKQFPFVPDEIVYLGRIDFGSLSNDDEQWSIPANTTIQALLRQDELPKVLYDACRNIVNRNVRNIATIGGHIASNKSCADVIPALVALEASLQLLAVESGERSTCKLEELVRGELPPSLILRVLLPKRENRLAAVANYTRSSNDISLITVAVSYSLADELIEAPIVAMGGVAKHVVRLPGLEEAIDGSALPPRDSIEEWVREEVEPISDIRGSAEFKRHLAGVLAAKTIHKAYSANGRPS